MEAPRREPATAGCSIPLTEERAITLHQLRTVESEMKPKCAIERWTDRYGKPLAPECINLYDASKHFLIPATAERRCSYVELVATGPQRPAWFVSHWWGEAVSLFLRCLEQHAADHTKRGADGGFEVDVGIAYWVCAYANNQHNLDAEVTADPSASSFVKAITLAEGRVVSVVDSGGVTYSRIWCCLEVHFALMQTYEIYTTSETPEARAVGITDGPCAADNWWTSRQTPRQASFPLELLRRALLFRVQDGQASVASDRQHILNYMAGRRGDALELPPLAESPLYEATTARLHGAFTAAALRLLLEGGEPMELHVERLASSGLRKLSLSLDGCNVPSLESFVSLLVKHLPPTLEVVKVDLGEGGSDLISSEVRRSMLDGVLQRVDLAKLKELNMYASQLEGFIPKALGGCTALWWINLSHNQLSGAIPEVLAKCTSLKRLNLSRNRLAGTIPVALAECAALVAVNVSHNQLSGCIPEALANLRLEMVNASNNQLDVTPEVFLRLQKEGKLKLFVDDLPSA